MTPDNQLRRTPATTETHCQVKCILIQLIRRITAASAFSLPTRWIASGRCSQKKVRPPKRKRLPNVPSDAEARAILGRVRKPVPRTVFLLMYACGLRISEAAPLPVTAIDKTSGLLRVVGKGNKERVVPVPRPVHESLRRMWQAEDHRDRHWLFPNSWRTGPVTTNVLVRTFADAVKAAISRRAAGNAAHSPSRLRDQAL